MKDLWFILGMLLRYSDKGVVCAMHDIILFDSSITQDMLTEADKEALKDINSFHWSNTYQCWAYFA